MQTVDSAYIPPPPPPPEEEPEEEEEEQEEEPPELAEETPPLDLSQLELMLNPGFSGWMGGDFAVKLNTMGARGEDLDELFSLADLDQKPRCIYQPSPTLNAKLRKKAPGKVNVIFIVDERGRVQDTKVRSSSDPIFECTNVIDVFDLQ